ncbi:MAG TPA: rod shape-determining protein RodA [Dehalococcoidia bacterium]|nr:rod shape-determining protein RodA [Dehalococcoidia bacterium]
MNLRALGRLDPLLLLAAILLVSYGIVLLYSATLSQYPHVRGWEHPAVRQGAFALLGAVVALAVAATNYRHWGRRAPYLYLVSLALLMAVLVVGERTFGSRRWLLIMGTPVQASEPAKLCLVLALAKFLSDRPEGARGLKTFLLALALALPPAALIMAEPDLGSTAIVALASLGLIMLAGARLSHVLTFVTAASILAPFIFMALGDYQRHRLALFLNPSIDPLGAGFNVRQAEISVGAGGLLGRGLTQGTQTQLEFLQTRTTDYIFSVLGEELGFIGGMLLLGIFLLLLWRALGIATLAPDPFGRFLAAGIALIIIFQVFINIGVNIRLLPVTGVPLPFVSQGGSSLVTLFIAVGLLQSIWARRRYPFEP